MSKSRMLKTVRKMTGGNLNAKYLPNKVGKKSPSQKSKLLITWKKFCNDTKLAGLHYIGCHRNSIKGRIILLLVWLIGFALSAYKCSYCLNEYLNRDTQTIITYNSMDKLQFPAITICHIIGFKKSIIGPSEDFLRLITHVLVRKPEELKVLKQQIIQTCYTGSAKKKDNDTMADILIKQAQFSQFESFYKTISVDSSSSVKKCWWLNQETNCSELFLNHQIENDVCFTFNQNSKYLDSNQASIGVAVYGAKKYKERIIKSFGSTGALKLVLDVVQEEYCLSLIERFGAGFRVYVHDSHSQSNYNLDSLINLSPGFDYTITLKPITYDRRNFTEFLQRCTSFVYNFLKPNQTEYNQESCLASCFAERVFQKCKCLPVEASSPLLSKATAAYLGLKTGLPNYCIMINDDQRNCLADQMVHFLAQNPESICPKCKKNCLETEYDYQLSSKKLSHHQIKAISQFRRTNVSIEKNFMFVSFMFEDNNLVTIREIQAFTSLNFYMSIGGTLGLFLGFSTISLYEVVHYVLISFSILKGCCQQKRRRMSKVRPTVFITLKQKTFESKKLKSTGPIFGLA